MPPQKKDRVRVEGGQNQERTIKILLYTPDLAKNIKGLLLKIKSPTPHNPTVNIWFGCFGSIDTLLDPQFARLFEIYWVLPFVLKFFIFLLTNPTF